MEKEQETWTEKLKYILIENIPLLSVVRYEEIQLPYGLTKAPIQVPDGKSVYKEWSLRSEFSSVLVEDELVHVLDMARKQLANQIANHVQKDLLKEFYSAGSPEPLKRLPNKVRQYAHWYAYIVSPEQWLFLQTQNDYHFDGEYFEGVKTYRHRVNYNIIVNTVESRVWNLRSRLKVDYVPETDIYKLTTFVSGHFLFR